MREHTIEQFVRELASGSPTPGGGSVAALAAALSAALSCMVANLGLARESSPELEACRNDLIRLYEACLQDIWRDAEAYQQVVLARKLPKQSAADTEARTAALQHSLKGAAAVPFETAGHVVEMLELAVRLAPHARSGYVSDLGVANFLALASLMSSAINVETNLHAIRDAAFVEDMKGRLADLEAQGHRHFEALEATVKQRLTTP